jgi:hypothetical protein
MNEHAPPILYLPSHRKVARELSDEALEELLLAGDAESSPGYLLALLAEYERRAKAVK